MGRIFLVRHGETEGNVKQFFRGKLDLPLDARGREEALAVADRLVGAGVTRILSSPLARALDTARPLAARLGLTVEPDPAFDDVDVGQWQGMAVAEVEHRHPNLFQIWRNNPGIFRFPHGESLAAVQKRAFERFVGVAREHAGATVAVFTHQVLTRTITLEALGLPLDAYWKLHQTTGAVNAFEWTGDGFRLLAFNLGYEPVERPADPPDSAPAPPAA